MRLNAGRFGVDKALTRKPSKHIEPMFSCWANITDDGPTLKQHCLNISCLLGSIDSCDYSIHTCSLVGPADIGLLMVSLTVCLNLLKAASFLLCSFSWSRRISSSCRLLIPRRSSRVASRSSWYFWTVSSFWCSLAYNNWNKTGFAQVNPRSATL